MTGRYDSAWSSAGVSAKCLQLRLFHVLSAGSGLLEVRRVEPEAGLRRLLLDHEEPAGVRDGIVALQVETEECDVGLQRAAEERVTSSFGSARQVGLVPRWTPRPRRRSRSWGSGATARRA